MRLRTAGAFLSEVCRGWAVSSPRWLVVVMMPALAVPCFAQDAEGERERTVMKAGGTVWAYWDKSAPPNGDWFGLDFDDSKWKRGSAPLGYGDPVNTTLSFGDDSRDKPLVAFFRHRFKLDKLEDAERPTWVGNVKFDDAIAIYLNGKEVYRKNLPAGELKPTTRSVQALGDPEEERVWPFTIDPKAFKKGDNVIAARVHQTNAGSSDLMFAMSLVQTDQGKVANGKIVEPLLREREGAPVVRAALVIPAVPLVPAAQAVRARRSFSHLTDGEVQYVDQDGVMKTRRQDALTQALAMVPAAKLVRTLEGDSVVKLAAQYGIDADLLARLNRSGTGRIFAEPGVACVSWQHIVQSGDTLQSLAKTYSTQVETLAAMNADKLTEGADPAVGVALQVPGEFSYHYRKGGQCYLRIARYHNAVARQVPFDPASRKTKVAVVQKRQDLEAFAKEHKVTVDFLQKMNNLDANTKVLVGQRLLIEFSVEARENATLESLAAAFQIPVKRLVDVNPWAENAPVPLPKKRLHIPIGERYRSSSARVQASNETPAVVEVVLE